MRISTTAFGLALVAALPALSGPVPDSRAAAPVPSAEPLVPGALVHRIDGCDVLVLWHTYRGRIDFEASGVRVKGALTWTRLWEGARFLVRGPISYPASQPSGLKTNGVVWNWPEELRQERCDLSRRYRFRVVGLDETVTGRSNEPWVGVERWIYYPSKTGWTQRTRIDVGYLDHCIMDGTTCGKPYYPSGATPILSGQ